MVLFASTAGAPSGVSAPATRAGRWSWGLLHLLVAAGAATVTVGAYSTWATFYAGLIARDGVSGHGRYFIGLAAAALVASLLSSRRGVWAGLRWASVPAGLAIAGVALRDLRNLDALVGDPSAALYVPARGDGLLIVIAGALMLAAAPFARPVRAAGRAEWRRTAIAAASVASMAILVPGLYGEYYAQFAPGAGGGGGHTGAVETAHALTAVGLLLAAGALHAALLAGVRRRRSRARAHGVAG